MSVRVILVTGSLPPEACGVGDYTQRLASALADAGQSVELLGHREWSIAGTRKALEKLSADKNAILHLQYPTMGYGYSLGPQLCIALRRGVVTLHEFSQAHPLRKLSLLPFAVRSSSLVMTSAEEASSMTARMPWIRRRLRIIPIGSNIPPPAHVRLQRRANIVYFGLIAPRKGLESFLELARLVRSESLDWDMSIIGKTPPGQEQYQRRLQELSAPHHLRWLLDGNAEAVSELLSKAGAAYLPFPDGASERRGSLKAAMTCGVPCITTSGAHIPPELARATMIAANPKQALEHAKKTLEDEGHRERFSHLSESYSRQFSWDTIAKLHMDLYEELRKSQG